MKWFALAASAAIGGSMMIAAVTTADDIRDRQWHLAFLQIQEAHGKSSGDGVSVAVIDTGVDARHPDLAGNVLNGTVMIPGEPGDGTTDSNGHGTSMGGLIAAHGHGDRAGVLGIAPHARILPVKISTGVLQGEDHGELAAAIDYAVASKARVISISIGTGRSERLQRAVESALAANIVIVAAVSNTNVSLGIAAPASYPGVVAAAAVDRSGHHTDISITGPEVVLAAPGVEIVSTAPGGGYSTGTGTSDATAIIAGAAALVRARFPNLSAAEVVHRLTATATDAGPPGRDEEYGFGVLNLVDALTKDVPPIQGTPTAPVTPTTRVAGPNPGNGGSVPSGLIFAVIALLLVAGGAWTLFRRRTG
jgi:type VII secretion-associated serine protease mycosin